MADRKAVIFDLGRVLVDYDYTRLFGFFADHGLVVTEESQLLARSRLEDYECGHIDDDTFFAHLGSLMPVGPDEASLRRRWLNIFTPVDRMLSYASELKTRVPVYILSNVSSAHFVHLERCYGLTNVAHDILTSFEAGCMKPDEAIYRAAERRFALNPDDILFVDDVAENIDGALSRGWSAIHHRRPHDTMSRIDQWLGS